MDQDELRKRLADLGFGESLSLDELASALASPQLNSDAATENATFTVVQSGGAESADVLVPSEEVERIEPQQAALPSVEEQLVEALTQKLGVLDQQLHQLTAPGGELSRSLDALRQASADSSASANGRDLQGEIEAILRQLL